jgi:5'-nucleotidase
VFEKRIDPRGKTYYWLAGELLEDVEETSDLAEQAPTDVQAIRDNYITITPLQYNLTSGTGIGSLQQYRFGVE